MRLRSGERGGIFTTSIPVPSATAVNLFPNLSPLSRMTYLGPEQYGVASRSYWTAQASVGQRVTLKWTTSRVPWTTKKNAKMGRKKTS